MAQKIEYWQQIIIDQLATNNIVVSGSRTSVRRIWTYAVAVCIWTLDILFGKHKEEVSAIIEEKMPHRVVGGIEIKHWISNMVMTWYLIQINITIQD
ncbi:hypothetical protein [Pedobacter sp. NJ-S-72]